MIAKYLWETDEADYEIVIAFKVIPGTPMTFDYPGDPAEIDYLSYTCKANPEAAKKFADLMGEDYALIVTVDKVCFDVAEAMYEQSQCDD